MNAPEHHTHHEITIKLIRETEIDSRKTGRRRDRKREIDRDGKDLKYVRACMRLTRRNYELIDLDKTPIYSQTELYKSTQPNSHTHNETERRTQTNFSVEHAQVCRLQELGMRMHGKDIS